MKHFFTFIFALCACAYASAATTITVDANLADWAEVPMISEPGATPMLKMLVPQTDVTLPAGTAFAALLVDNEETTLAADGPVFYVDADMNTETGTNTLWFCSNIGYEYQVASWTGASYAVDANKYEIAVKQTAFTNDDFSGEFTTWMTYKWGNAENGGYYIPATGDWDKSACYPMHVRPYSFRNLEGTITTAEMYSCHKALSVVADKITFSGSSKEIQQWASWAVELTPGIYNVTAELEAATASSVCVELVDLATNTVLATKNTGNLWGKTGTVAVGEWDLRDIPAGKYMLKYRNVYQYAAFSLSSLTFTYAGGAATDIPAASLALRHATVYSPKAIERDDEHIKFMESGYNADQYIDFRIHLTTPAAYNVVLGISTENGHQVQAVLQQTDGTVIATLDEGTKWTTGELSLDMGMLDMSSLAAGTYVLRVQNAMQYSRAILKSVAVTYAGGATLAIPGTLMAADAMFSAEGTRADGQISFPASNIQNDEIVFKIHAENAICNSDVSITISTTNGHQYLVEFYDNTNTIVATVSEDRQQTTDGTFSLGMVSLPAGDYTVKIINQTQWSAAKFESLAIIYNGGATIALPGTILAADALYSARGSREGEYIVFPADGSLPDDYITIYASVAEAGTYQFTLHCSTTDYHQYKAIIRDRATHALIDEVGRAYGNNTADVVLGTANLPAGEVEIELHQTNPWAHAKFQSLEVASTEAIQHVYTLTVSEAGFSTLVVPFDAISISTGAEVYNLTVSGDEIIATAADGIYAGQPVLIKAPAGNYNVRSAYGAVKDFSGDLVNGALHGTYTEIQAPISESGEYSYVLQKHGSVVAFYQLLAESNKTILPYRAYLSAAYDASAASSTPMRIRFAEETTTDIAPIQSVALEDALRRGEVYDITGRRVGTVSAQGIYIIAGKKLYIL